MQPRVPIQVDGESGVWTTDGLAMLYVPRHFFMNNHNAVSDALGREKYNALLYEAGYKSAYQWCAKAGEGLSGMAVFEHYLARLSARGWGQFSFQQASLEEFVIRVDNSAFVLQEQMDGVHEASNSSERLCAMFAGWFSGAATWVAEAGMRTGEGDGQKRVYKSEEVQCAHEGSKEHCLFRVTAKIKEENKGETRER